MPRFGSNSRMHLASCHIDIVTVCNAVIEWFDFSILEGHRNAELQQRYLERGLTKLEPGKSKHNSSPSLAFHALPYDPKPPYLHWTHLPSMYYLAGALQATAEQLLREKRIEHLIVWGGLWTAHTVFKPPAFFDGAHYELVDPGVNWYPQRDAPLT